MGLCDSNSNRLAYAKGCIGKSCAVFSDFEKIIKQTKPDLVIVTTKDSNHHEFIIRGLEMGCDVLTEKPMTTDEIKCQSSIEAEKKMMKT